MEVETGGEGVCFDKAESRWMFEESDVIGMRTWTGGVVAEGSVAEDGSRTGRDKGTPVGVGGWETV